MQGEAAGAWLAGAGTGWVAEKELGSMKRELMAFAAAGMLALSMAGAVSADTDNPKACFGQDRADYVTANGGHGQIISDRAQDKSTRPEYPNDNVKQNKEYKEACQAAGE